MKTRQNLFRLDKIYIDQTKSIKTRQNIFKRCGGSFNILLNFVKKITWWRVCCYRPPTHQYRTKQRRLLKSNKKNKKHGAAWSKFTFTILIQIYKIKISLHFLCCYFSIFSPRNRIPNNDPEGKMNADQSGSGSTALYNTIMHCNLRTKLSVNNSQNTGTLDLFSLCGPKSSLFRSVSWVREKDSHILAVDGEIFIQDQRFTSLVKENNQWTLMVRTSTSPL